MASISGKVCWVTGASSGIGEALSLALNQQGAKVIISARRREELDRVKAASQHPDLVYILPLDLAEIPSFGAKTEEAVNAFGQVDMLFNNGGVSQRSLARDTPLEVDRRLMEINFFGTVALSKALLPHFTSRKSGHYIIVSSLVGKFGSPLRSSYAASKHALHGFFDSLRAEHYLDNIKVTIVCPGFIKTQVSVNALNARGEKQNTMDNAQANGMSAETCARKIIRAVKKEKEEVNIGGKETLGIYVKRLFPAVFSRILRKAKVT
jgi:short-subunit dehydrogenase